MTLVPGSLLYCEAEGVSVDGVKASPYHSRFAITSSTAVELLPGEEPTEFRVCGPADAVPALRAFPARSDVCACAYVMCSCCDLCCLSLAGI